MLRFDEPFRAKHTGPFDHVFKFSHIAGPVICIEYGLSLGSKPLDRLVIPARPLFKKMRAQKRQIFQRKNPSERGDLPLTRRDCRTLEIGISCFGFFLSI